MSSRLADRLGPHTPSHSVAWSFGCSGKLQRCGLRPHTVVIAPQELITQQSRDLSPPARCTPQALIALCPTAQAVSRVSLPFSRTAFTCQYSRPRIQTTSPLRPYPHRSIEGRFSGPFHTDPRITRIQNIYFNPIMSYYDIDAILTDAEVRKTQPCRPWPWTLSHEHFSC